jgi:hypothetical protein
MVSHSDRSQSGTRVPNFDSSTPKEGRRGRSGRKRDKGADGRRRPE